MPRISEFIKELLAEPWDGTEYHEKLPERLEQLNAAQLQGIINDRFNVIHLIYVTSYI